MDNIQELIVASIKKSVTEMFQMMSTFTVTETAEIQLQDYLTGCLQLNSDNFNGLIKIEIEKEFAKSTVSDMTGVHREDLENAFVMDGVGEIVNMVTGFTKSKLREENISFDLTPPFVIYGKDYGIKFKNSVRRDRIYYTSVQGDLAIEVITY